MKTKKNTYITPSLRAIMINGMVILAGSVYGNNGINYGGKDTEGTQNPSSIDEDFEMEEADYQF